MSLPVSRWPEAARTLARTFGLRGAALRAQHEARRAGGWFRKAPRSAATSWTPASWLRVEPERLQKATDPEAAIARADRVSEGEYQAFRHLWRPLPITPEDWHRQPTTGQTAEASLPWWQAEHLSAGFGDIKEVWEPARFGWLYDLVRGFVLTKADRYAEAAFTHIEAWADSSKPFCGLHWSCGQETSIRALALLYAEANLDGALAATPARRALVRDILAASGERVADALGYAISQRNNHALSEATGLVALGARFAGDHPEAERWVRDGHRWLERLIPEQIAPDGWYIQHSFTYARLALDQCVLAEQALRSRGLRLSDRVVARIGAAANLLAAVTDGPTGDVPNHGPNDGALVFPATLATYRDMRPVLTAVASTWDRPLPEDLAPDPEVSAWLNAPLPRASSSRTDGVESGASGWAVARVGAAHVVLRAGRYASRPGHLDALQLDVRFGGRSVVADAGTFSYNAPPPWRNGLVGADVHNGPLIDGLAPGVRGPRFLWYLWPEADLLFARMRDGEAEMQAKRPGVVRRTVRVRPDCVTVRDEALTEGDELAVCWLVPPGIAASCIEVEGASRVVSAAEGSVKGWVSPHYGERIPGQSVIATAPAQPGGAIVTHIRPPDLPR